MKVYHLVDSTSDHCALLVTDSREPGIDRELDASNLKLIGLKERIARTLLKPLGVLVWI